jgi:CRISPR-associated RAMP protein (TIGR02581 family)
MSDLGVMLDLDGAPVLPGSSLKGRLRNTCESLAPHLVMKACCLDREATGVDCVSDVKYYSRIREQYSSAEREGIERRLEWIDEHTCDVCKLFGSPLETARLRIGDGRLEEDAGVVEIRDGVVIDRDSHTAVDGLKYDYEVVPAGSRFEFVIDLNDPTDNDLALLGAALFEWHAGFSLGGFTSRGLGRALLRDVAIAGADLSDPEQRRKFLLGTDSSSRLGGLGDWESYFQVRIDERLKSLGS